MSQKNGRATFTAVAAGEPRPQSSWLQNRGIVQQRVYQAKVQNVNGLRQHLTDVSDRVELCVIDDAIDKYHVRSMPAF